MVALTRTETEAVLAALQESWVAKRDAHGALLMQSQDLADAVRKMEARLVGVPA